MEPDLSSSICAPVRILCESIPYTLTIFVSKGLGPILVLAAYPSGSGSPTARTDLIPTGPPITLSELPSGPSRSTTCCQLQFQSPSLLLQGQEFQQFPEWSPVQRFGPHTCRKLPSWLDHTGPIELVISGSTTASSMTPELVVVRTAVALRAIVANPSRHSTDKPPSHL